MALTAMHVAEQLRALTPDDMAATLALARQIGEEASRGPIALVAQALGNDRATVRKAIEVAGLIADQAMMPLLRAPQPPDAGRRVWRLQALVETELEVRRGVAQTGLALLDDRDALPQAPASAPRAESEPPTPRVCDEVYLLLRSLLKQDDDRTAQRVVASVFLHLPTAHKDAAIAQFKASRTWINVLER